MLDGVEECWDDRYYRTETDQSEQAVTTTTTCGPPSETAPTDVSLFKAVQTKPERMKEHRRRRRFNLSGDKRRADTSPL